MKLEPLSPDLVELLDAERAIPPVDAGLRARLRGRVFSSIRFVGGPGGSGGGGPTGGAPHAAVPAASVPPPAASLFTRIVEAKALIAGAFVAGAVLGAGVTRLATPRFASTPALVSAVPRVIVVSAPAARSAAPAVAESAAPAEVPKRLGARPRAEPPAHATRDTDLAAEGALLSIARTAVGRGDAQAALKALREHKRRFPRGRLSEERDSLWVQALALSGNSHGAAERARAFDRRYPHSFLRRAVDQALGVGK